MQTNIFRGTARNIVKDDNGTKYYYHNTAIVTTVNGNPAITLDTGGWFTSTTKRAMNQVSNQFNLGFHVFQKNYEWFVNWKGVDHKFKGDSIVII